MMKDEKVVVEKDDGKVSSSVAWMVSSLGTYWVEKTGTYQVASLAATMGRGSVC